MERRGAPQDPKHHAVKHYFDQEREDDLLISFGADYFNGARQGAAFGGLITLWLCRRAFVDLRSDQLEVIDLSHSQKYEQAKMSSGGRSGVSAALGQAGVVTGSASVVRRCPMAKQSVWRTLLRGIQVRPLMTIGCIALGLTSTIKGLKFVLSNRRYQEFMVDEAELLMLHEAAQGDPKLAEELHEAMKALAKPSGKSVHAGPAPRVAGRSSGRQWQPAEAGEKQTPPTSGVSLNTLVPPTTLGPIGRRPPTFWDGVAVGLLGSLMDCYLPTKPIHSYYAMRCGIF